MLSRRLNFPRFTGDATPVARTFGDVVLYCIGSNVANRAVEFSSAPEMSAPKAFLDARKLLEQSPCGDALEELDNLAGGKARVEANKQVHMIGLHLQFIDGEAVLFGDLAKNPLASGFNLRITKYIIPVFRAENRVNAHLPKSMAHANQIHLSTSETVPISAPLGRAVSVKKLKRIEVKQGQNVIQRNSSLP